MSQELAKAFDGYNITWVVDDAGDVFAVGKHVCAALGYSDAKQAMVAHCKGGGTHTYPLATAGGVQQARLIPESDIYRLVMGSRLPAAQRFKRWPEGESRRHLIACLRQTADRLEKLEAQNGGEQ